MPKKSLIVRVVAVFLLIIIIFIILATKLYEVQIERHEELFEKAKQRYTVTKKPRGERGRIFDIEGNLLAGNQPCFDIAIDPSVNTFANIEDCDKIAKYFSENADADYEKLLQRLMHKIREDGKVSRYAFVAKDVNLDTIKEIKSHISENKWEGISFKYGTKRYYPCNELFANIIGFVNISEGEQIAQGGIEKIKDKSMRKEDGEIIVEHDRKGIPFEEHVIQRCHDGNDVYLTVSQKIQMVVEEELDKLMAKFSPKVAYAVMADPKNGNIMAIAQRPTFNPNDRNTMKDPDICKNKVVSDVFEPGSIMKAIAIAGALDFGIVSPNDKFNCEKGGWFFSGKLLRDAHPYDILTVTEIIQKSSNIGTAKIAIMMGDKKLYNILRRFGFGQETGIPIKPESIGIFSPLKKWSKLSISRIPIGQGIAVSPLQMLRAYCVLANGGNLVSLRLIDREANPETGEIVHFQIEPSPHVFMRKDSSKKIIEMLKLVTKKGGTAERAAVKGYDVAGKTGTSQKVVNGQYSESLFHASFIGFVPADDPAFVMLVMADEPQGSHYGGVVAAETFSAISKKVLQMLNIQPQYPLECENDSEEENKP